MKTTLKFFTSAAVLCACCLHALAAVPIDWSCDVASPNPRQIQAYRGETLQLACTFIRAGKPFAEAMQTATLYWQTNGMASLWWQTNATVSGPTVSAAFTPAMDCGAAQYRFFFGASDAAGVNYRANGSIRFADSPGATPSSAPPTPGTTWNFSDVTVIGAPWATLEQIDAELAEYVTTQTLAAVVADERSITTAGIAVAASNAQANAIAQIPSLSGYATQRYVQDSIEAIPPPDLSGYASKAYANAAASNAQANAIAQIPSLSGYATQSYVQDAVTNVAVPSLAGYATQSYADAAASNAQANAIARIPSLSGYATQAYVQDAVTNVAVPSLAGYATQSYADAAASNAQANAIARIPSLSGYATQSYVQNAISNVPVPSLDGYATEAYANAAASNAQANAIAQIPSLSGYATQSYVQNAISNVPVPSLDGYATEDYANAAASNVAAQAAVTYLTGVPDYYATKSWVRDQVETGGGQYSAGVWNDGYVLDATGIVWYASITTNAIPTPPYMTNTTIIIEGGVTTTVETVTTNYTYEVVTNLAPAFKAFLYDASTSPESAIADAALTGPAFYSDSSRLFFRFSDVLYECDDGTSLEYSNGRWWYSDGVNTYDCINGNGLPAEDMSPPAILQWKQGGIWMMVTSGSVLETFPLLYNRAGLAPADYETVSNRAMSAVQPAEMEAATNALAGMYIPIVSSESIVTSVSLFLNDTLYEQGSLRLTLPDQRNVDAISFVSSPQITNAGAVAAIRADLAASGYVVTNEYGALTDLADVQIDGELTVNGTNVMSEIAGKASLGSLTAVSNAATAADVKASTAIAYLQGEDVRVVVTNYDSIVHMPSASIQQQIEEDGSNTWSVVWDELTRWTWLVGTYLPTNYYTKAETDALLDEKADRAWGFYESHTGEYAPDGYTWLSSPKIAIAGGLAYQRTLTSAGAVWVLVSNGLVAETDGEENGFFRIKDDEGNATFEIVRGNKRTVGAAAAGIRVTRSGGSNIVTVPYAVVSDDHPTIYGATNLSVPEWTELSAQWTGQSGAWTAQVSSASSTLFIKGEYETGGETYISNGVPISVSKGIYCTDGVHKVRPVYNNGSITWEVVP